MNELEHLYQHPYAVAPAAAMVDDRHKMWRRPALAGGRGLHGTEAGQER
jgi:hypothetical protein